MQTLSEIDSNAAQRLPTPCQILEALRIIKDPEIGLNIVDLGLVYKVEFKEKVAHVFYTVTNPMCPISQILDHAIQLVVRKMEGVENCIPHLVFNPPWNPSMMSERRPKELS